MTFQRNVSKLEPYLWIMTKLCLVQVTLAFYNYGFFSKRYKCEKLISMKECTFTVIATFLVIIFSQNVNGNNECSNYTFLNESNRAKAYYNSSIKRCDRSLQGWYRFGGGAGKQMADSCVNRQHCGAGMPGWLKGSHPSVADGIVTRKVCFRRLADCCRREIEVDVRNCGSFYVYKLNKPPICNARYCGNGPPLECSSYKFLTESSRAKTYSKRNRTQCDRTLSAGWYRFGKEAGNKMADTCVEMRYCGTFAAGWLNGPHPSVADGAVGRRVCFNLHGCCAWSTFITVRNCGKFYVYKLKPLNRCARFCGNGLLPTPAPTTTPVRSKTKFVKKVSARKIPVTKQALADTSVKPHSIISTRRQTTVYTRVDDLSSKKIASKNNLNLMEIIVILLAIVILMLIIVCVFFIRRLRNVKRNPPDDQDGSSLNPANAARQLGLMPEAEVDSNEHTELASQRPDRKQECEYAMLNARTMMVQGDGYYASLVTSEQGASDSVSEPSTVALPSLQNNEERIDDQPIYVNKMSPSEYVNV